MSEILTMWWQLLRDCDDKYYNTGNSPLSDKEYDTLKEELRAEDPNNPYFCEVGAPVNGNKICRHRIPMGSLNNVRNEEEFRAWWNKTNPGNVIVQYKYDGLSIGLEYKNGSMVRGLLRGDGITGEEQTENIKNCWHKYNNSSKIDELNCSDFNGCVRGEGIVYKSDFNETNFPGESNPRNSAVGAVRKENSPRSKWVRFICYDVAGCEFDTEEQKLKYMTKLGLPVAEYHSFDNPDDVMEFYNSTGRDSLPFVIDGLVIKTSSIKRQKELGEHNQRPKHSVAFKFATMSGISKITNIDLTVGHTGAIIPTAEYESIMIDGRNFSHTLLDNFDTIERLDLGIGDIVEIEICGDIIPKIKRVVEHAYKCPECGFVGTLKEQEEHHKKG